MFFLNRPFDAKRYKRLLEGLDVVTLKLSEVQADNEKLRIDSGYFAKLPVETQKRIEDMEHIQLGAMCSTFRKGIFDIKADSYVSEGVPFVRIGNLRNGLIDDADLAYITEKAHRKEHATALSFGDLVLSKTAYPAASFVNIPECNVSQDTIAVQLSPSGRRLCNSGYLAVFLNSRFGLALMKRQFQGNVQEHLSLTDGRKIPVPLLAEELQQRVASLMSDADRSFEKATQHLSVAEATLIAALGLTDWQPPRLLSYTRRASQAFAAGRMDAEYFREEYLAAATALKQAGAIKFLPLDDLLVSLTNGHTPLHHDLTVGDVPFLCAEHVTDFELHYDSEKRILAQHHQTELARTRVRNGDVLLSIKGRVGNFALAEDVPGDVNINQDVALLRFKDTLPLWWILAFLNSPFGKLQVQQNSTGGINPFLGLANVRKLLVPVFQEKVMRDVGDRTRERVLAARVAHRRASELLVAAQRAVEIAIEQDEAAALAYLDGFDVKA